MAWSETTKMQERMRFVLDAEGELFTMTELCERCGISRMTGHKWVRRFRRDGVGALEDRCRAPLHCPHRTDAKVMEALVEARHRHPYRGARKLILWLGEEAARSEPSRHQHCGRPLSHPGRPATEA